ncbi:hypothetical protein LAZ40_03090 [Cereibacter sphaeroides]|uniref:hypothetical protein n=1 Tax=Cereibacter sphaeroides TaxID=1063 RepID=UPI001F45B282|nr:hypothetical protein [Cereibacter sphaeroides]MCE6958040.1 hypothetical protein [Cereibacter sphaeroides]MCE6971975.1 hypothetical protein [Cereibacter sphaeroides]
MQVFATAAEAGAAFYHAEASDLPLVIHSADNVARTVARTVRIGDTVQKSRPSADRDGDFAAGFREAERRDSAEARDLARRDTLTAEQQQRLVGIVERLAGREAVRELRAGHAEALSHVIGDAAERSRVAEAFLRAEQAQGHDRADAIEAVQREREAARIARALEERRAAERQALQTRARERDEGHEL